MTAYHTGQVQ